MEMVRVLLFLCVTCSPLYAIQEISRHTCQVNYESELHCEYNKHEKYYIGTDSRIVRIVFDQDERSQQSNAREQRYKLR